MTSETGQHTPQLRTQRRWPLVLVVALVVLVGLLAAGVFTDHRVGIVAQAPALWIALGVLVVVAWVRELAAEIRTLLAALSLVLGLFGTVLQPTLIASQQLDGGRLVVQVQTVRSLNPFDSLSRVELRVVRTGVIEHELMSVCLEADSAWSTDFVIRDTKDGFQTEFIDVGAELHRWSIRGDAVVVPDSVGPYLCS
ncbi:hypothetical protein [Nocardioides sp. 1609]|uniref:hypothetical protein n=1 Tax=Nocardioides sp. 1609 TaxID=2508327 RepID=UPI00106F1F19|nr:hypothetical protein [Nocardioides sp. 1609]